MATRRAAPRPTEDRSSVPGPVLRDGDSVTVTLGEERFEGFSVGPVSATTALRDGETAEAAAARLAAFLEALFEAQFEIKARHHRQRRDELAGG